ncbi:hypothetical protein [Gorillibacterium timonense]|uniref:hypothetical protein n=1 Tax=Gorillibacterium timonense TaxID=1689269 RepID=UPI00071D56E0|nr:hypothetical protein [Gorillibacterium timonense]
MNEGLHILGLLCIILTVLYAAKRIAVRLEVQRLSKGWGQRHYEENAVYRAARLFAAGGSAEELKRLLSDSYQFDSAKVEQILSLSYSGRVDHDYAYVNFIKAVNDVLGEEVYRAAQS